MVKYQNLIREIGKECPKCSELMERRKRIKPPKNKNYYYTEWDWCIKCKHLQHYSEYKSPDWLEDERQRSFIRSI